MTKDRKLLEWRAVATGRVRGVPLVAGWLAAQLPDLGRVILLGQGREFTRCLECNVVLEPAEQELVRELLPPCVSQTQPRFTRCPRCRKVFWPGTHWERMRQLLREARPNGRKG